jgi:thymidylate kinase
MMRSSDVAAGPLQLITDLCEALERNGVRYCHWKSTDALDRSSSGENDLDLLIAEDDVSRFEAILKEFGFVEATVPSSQRQPGIRHFYGLDGASGRLVDVHAHEWLILGDDATKNYRLPIEATYLATSTREGHFMVPTPELEFAVFVVRMMLKHGSPEAIMSGRGSLSRREREELQHLCDLGDPSTRWQALRGSAPMLDRSVLERCVASFDRERTFVERMGAWGELKRRLAPYARRSRGLDIWLQLWRRIVGRSRRRLFRAPPKKRPVGGGRVIALIGSDGSGKSTTAKALEGWLSPVFATSRIHLGKPHRSQSWIVVRAGIHVGRLIGVAGAGTPVSVGSKVMPAARPWRAWALIGMLTTRDRLRAAKRAQHLASRGSVVICDRYPLPQISVDGPRAGAPGADGLSRRLATIDRRYHARIPSPDIVIVLAVTPDVAMRRRPEADPRVIDARAREVLDAAWSADVVVIDATQPFDAVLRDVKLGLWSRL